MAANRVHRARCGALVKAGPGAPPTIANRIFPDPMARSAAARSSDETPLKYEEALAELERLVQAMETAQLPLDQLLGSYQRGAELLALCRARLEVVEQQVKVLEDGQLKAWEGSDEGR